MVGPTAPTPAFALNEKVGDPLAMYLSDILTVPASLAGIPAISVPCGFVRRGESELPVGLQILGPRCADARVLRAARVYQAAGEHHLVAPALAGGAL